MDFLEQIQTLEGEELESIIQKRIDELEEISKKDNDDIDTIGYHLEYNPTEYYIEDTSDGKYFNVDVRCFYSGYIPKNTRMVYGMAYDNNRLVSNDGRYYYLDDDSYILEFCKYIKDKEIINEYELFEYILDFLRDYFGFIKTIEREEMLKMIYKADRLYFDPADEHKISWFKKKGNAMCSEYAILAGNILNVFGIDSYLVIGREKTGDEKGDSHAFNLISFKEKESNQEVNALIDFANFTTVLDFDFKKIGETPYIIELEELTEDFVKELVQNEKHITFEDYSYMIIGNSMIKIGYEKDRDYFIPNEITPDTTLKKKK